LSSVLYLVWAKTDFTGTCCSKSPVHRLSWKFGGRAPPQLQRVLALSPPRVGRLPCAQLRTTRDAAPSPARRARSMHAAVAVEVFHLSPPLASPRSYSSHASAERKNLRSTAATLPKSKKWVRTEVASLLSRATDVPRLDKVSSLTDV